MPARIKYDLRGPSLVENDVNQGLIIELPIQILDFDISNYSVARATDPFVLLRALAMVGTGPGDHATRFPQIHDEYPPPQVSGDPDFTFCTVFHQRITGLDAAKHILNASIRYRSPIGPQSPGVITYTRNQRTIQSWQRSSTTAGGAQVISIWYQGNISSIEHFDAPDSPNDDLAPGEAPMATVLTGWAQKLYTSRALEFIGTTTMSNWDSIKSTFNAAAGKINSNTEGVWAPRGKWLYLGPDVSVSNGGTIGSIVHRVIEASGPFGRWFPVLPFFDNHGVHPANATPEATLETVSDPPGFPPAVGTQIRMNGITMASNQEETDFEALFPTEEP